MKRVEKSEVEEKATKSWSNRLVVGNASGYRRVRCEECERSRLATHFKSQIEWARPGSTRTNAYTECRSRFCKRRTREWRLRSVLVRRLSPFPLSLWPHAIPTEFMFESNSFGEEDTRAFPRTRLRRALRKEMARDKYCFDNDLGANTTQTHTSTASPSTCQPHRSE